MRSFDRLQCNIDKRGRRARLIAGLLLLSGAGVAMFYFAISDLRSFGTIGWLIAGAAMLMGVFALFEASIGWCAVRALGFKTRL
jgi:hypothetical protein